MWPALTAVVLVGLEHGQKAGQVAWAVMVLVPAAAFALACVILSGRCEGQRRRFWHVMAAGMALESVALVWRAGAVLAGLPVEFVDIVYSLLTSAAVVLFAAGLVVRMRMISPATWVVQFLDAIGLAVVVTTLAAMPVASQLAEAAADAKANAAQPLVIATIAAGALSLLFTPEPWASKRVELVLASTTALALAQSWMELYGIVLSGSRFLPSVGVTLAAAFSVGALAPFLENPAARPPSTGRDDYDSVAWPYVTLSILPLAALAAVLRDDATVQAVAVGGLLAGLVVAVLRQIQVLRTQRRLLDLAKEHTEERNQDAAIARSLLEVARRLSVSPDRIDAERAVLNALAVATTAPVVRIVEPDETVTGDLGGSVSLGPEAVIALVRDARGEMAPGAPRHFHDPAAGVEGVFVAALTTSGDLGAVLCAEGKGWTPAPNEVDLISGLAHQLGVALERSSLVGRLAQSERLYRRIIDAVPVGVVEVDSSGIVVRSNQAFARITGLNSRRITGASMFELFAQMDLEPSDTLARFERNGTVRCRARVVTLDGLERMLVVDAASVGPERDGGRDAVLLVHDDTELVRLRRRVDRAAADVESRSSGAAERHAATSALAVDALSSLEDTDVAMTELAHAREPAAHDRVETARAAVDESVRTVQVLADALEART